MKMTQGKTPMFDFNTVTEQQKEVFFKYIEELFEKGESLEAQEINELAWRFDFDKIDLQAIIEKTIKNGGYTNNVKGRYVVAIKGFEKVVELKEFNENTLTQYINENGIEFGTWLHEGNIYLDKVECFDTIEVAIKEAEKRGEIAIFDTVELKEIKIQGEK